MVDSNAKGARRERELVNAFDDLGYGAIRTPASGSSTERELPDVLAGVDGAFYAIEAKASAGDPIYLDAEADIEALETFAGKFGAYPLVGARFDREDWAFFTPVDLYRTPGGNARVKKDDLEAEEAFGIEDL